MSTAPRHKRGALRFGYPAASVGLSEPLWFSRPLQCHVWQCGQRRVSFARGNHSYPHL